MDDRTPIRDARHGPARLHRPDKDGHLHPVGCVIEAICGRCVEPPGRRAMTYAVLDVAAGAMEGDRFVGFGRTVKLEYRVPAGSTRQAHIDFEMDVLGWWLDYDLSAAEVWLADHELWMGRRVRPGKPDADHLRCRQTDQVLPEPAARVVDRFLTRVDRALPGVIDGFYIVGSLALGGFRVGRSDIDFVATTTGPLSPCALKALRTVHR